MDATAVAHIQSVIRAELKFAPNDKERYRFADELRKIAVALQDEYQEKTKKKSSAAATQKRIDSAPEKLSRPEIDAEWETVDR